MNCSFGGLRGGGIEQKGKKTHRCGQQCGDCSGGAIRGINGNGQNNTVKKMKKKTKFTALSFAFLLDSLHNLAPVLFGSVCIYFCM